MMNMRILIIEDEVLIRKLMKLNLEMEGHEVVEVDDGAKALELVEKQFFDLIVLDLMLPNIDGFQICETIRLKNKTIKIIIVSAKDSVHDRVQGLKLGADDYLTKPFNLEEFLLRIQNLGKRNQSELELQIDHFTFGTNTIYFNDHYAMTAGGRIDLTPKEGLLLKMFVERQNTVVIRNQILQYVWGYDIYPSTRTIDNFILSFRKYFEENQKEPVYFHTIRGIGYKFTPNN
jgi:two-component system, OmpR family, alkaline phosphatase synthesis response regulator PhoP